MDFWLVIFVVSLFLNIILIYYISMMVKRTKEKQKHAFTAEMVGDFYDEYNEDFLKVYGEVIQAFRTTNIEQLLDYQIENIGIQPGRTYLDAGCGIGGPARYFAKKTGAKIEGLTISQEQVKKARYLINEQSLEDLVVVKHGDFHDLKKYYAPQSFDGVYFLESFGHAADHEIVINGAWDVLKPGGCLYVKDLFKKLTPIDSLKPEIQKEIQNINQAYRYNIADLNHVLDILRKKGFILSSLKTIDIKLEDFENLTISNEFQELTGINKIENLLEYIFPVDFFEIKCIKPWYDITVGNSRYFLQNLFYLQVQNRREEEL
jgi:ubiquinone/menaquinone biosynthesis C-methylase UbiE